MSIACGAMLLTGTPRLWAVEIDSVRVGTSGQTVIVVFKDEAGIEKAWVQDISTAACPQVTINGGKTVTLDKPIYRKVFKNWNECSGLPYVVFPLASEVLRPADRLTFSAPAGWATCCGGPLGAVRKLRVDNATGKSLLPPPSRDYRMKLGYILAPLGWSNYEMFANLVKSLGKYRSTNPPGEAVPLGPQGLPTSVTNGPELELRNSTTTPGQYTLLWDGPDQLTLANPELRQVKDHITGGADNTRVYATPPNRGIGRVRLKFLGTRVRNLRVYPPGVPTDGSLQFHPEFLRMMHGVRVIRSGQLMFNDTNLSTFDEFRKEDEQVAPPNPWVTATITKAEPYDNRLHYFAGLRAYWKFTTAQPHHFKTGYRVFVTTDAPVAMSNGTAVQLKNVQANILVLSPVEFALAYFGNFAEPTNPNRTITVRTATAVAGTVKALIPHGEIKLSEFAEMANAFDGCDLWFVVPHLLDDDSVHKVFAVLGKHLAKGRRVHVEYSNEVWNWAGYCGTEYAYGMAQSDPHPDIKNNLRRWYAKRAAQVWAIAKEEFRNLGRAEDAVGVLACQIGDVGAALDYALSQRITVDEVAVAPYYDVGPRHGDYIAAATKLLNVEQVCDLADINMQYNDLNVGLTMRALQARHFTGKLVAYEGGMQAVRYPALSQKENVILSRQWADHPRIAPLMRFYFERMQQAGIELLTYTDLQQDGGGPEWWGAYRFWNQRDGAGDGSDGGFDNLRDIHSPLHAGDLDSRTRISVKGWAMHDWMNHVNEKSAAKDQ